MIRSRTSGWLGGASTITDASCRVSRPSTSGRSTAASEPIACSIEWVGQQLQGDRDVAEGEVEVDQADPLGAALG